MLHSSLHFVTRALPAAAMAAAALLHPTSARAQLPFFPGAEGFGGTFAGAAPAGGWFSNATIYHVTNLNDSGAGSLRGAFVQNSTNKIIVFDVGGTIQLSSATLDIKNLSNYYIAGQTSPSPVTIIGRTTQITASNDKTNSNVVLRYLAFRGSDGGNDAITFKNGNLAAPSTNMIMDHVSASWAEDEDLSVANANTNVTVQYSIIADALTSDHAFGSLIRPEVSSSVSFHHNLYANNLSRQARFGTYHSETLTADFRNNVIYNWKQRASYSGGSTEPDQESADVNYVGNYLVAGLGLQSGYSATQVFSVDKNTDTRIYQSGNFVDSDRTVNPSGVPNGSLAPASSFSISTLTDQTLTLMGSPFATDAVTTQTAPNAFDQVLSYVGGSWWSRDAIDARIINNVRTNKGPPNGVAAVAPNAAELALVTGAPATTRPAGWDTDADGMPDAWELAHGLNPASAADNKLDFDNDGYVNVVEYLNDVGEFPAPAPIVFNGATNMRYAQITNWKTNDGGVTAGSNWQPSKYDVAQVRTGTVIVDAVGQHAGVLQVAPTAGDAATINFTSGWLDAATAIVVGAAGSGTVNHSGGLVIADAVTLGGAPGASGAYNLLGTGKLVVGALNKGANGGAFNFTGGTLAAAVVNFDLVNNGGAIAPGASPGLTHIHGNLTLNSGALQIEIGGTGAGQFDRVLIDGTAELGGTLVVTPVDLGSGVYTPHLGDVFPILAAGGGAGGMFDAFDLPALPSGLAWSINPGNVTVFLSVVSTTLNPADFNHDGSVNGADLAAWNGNFGLAAGALPSQGDANLDGAIDGADFLIWQQQLGAGPGVTNVGAAVPEPTAALLAVMALGIMLTSRGKMTILALPI